MFIDYTIDLVSSIAIVLYAVYFAAVVAGVILIWRGHDRRRWSGLLLIVSGLSAAALFTLMSSRYWIGHQQIIAVQLRPLAITVATVVLPLGLAIFLAVSLRICPKIT